MLFTGCAGCAGCALRKRSLCKYTPRVTLRATLTPVYFASNISIGLSTKNKNVHIVLLYDDIFQLAHTLYRTNNYMGIIYCKCIVCLTPNTLAADLISRFRDLPTECSSFWLGTDPAQARMWLTALTAEGGQNISCRPSPPPCSSFSLQQALTYEQDSR